MPLTAYVTSLSTLGSTLLLGPLAVVGCGESLANSSVYFYFRPVRDLIPSGAQYMVSRRLLEGFPPRDQLRQSCPSQLAPSPSIQLSAMPLLGGQVSSGGLPGKESQVRDRGRAVAAGTHVTAGGCVCCMSQGRTGHWLLPWLDVQSRHRT